ncbi:MAG TPA: DUF1775 domain-containing protein [Actinoplanes sp.]|nr:DUF1775 domain-containing protein [Actinoplanes sp.]
MSRFLITRRAGVLTAAAAAAVLGTAAPALADATVSPSSAPQGSGANLTFRVTNTEQSAITRVKLLLPADSPIAEVYPLSVDDWAPQITNRKLQTPLATIHGGTPATETAADITWIAMPGKSLAPGKSADLSVAVGPLPTLSQMQFTIQATYANGSAGAAMPPVSLALTPATAEDQAAAHAGHAGAATTAPGSGSSAADDSAFAAVVAANQGPSLWSIAGWICAVLAGAGAIVAVLRGRRRSAVVAADTEAADTESAEEPENDETKEPVGAGAGKIRVSSWRYQDGPE